MTQKIFKSKRNAKGHFARAVKGQGLASVVAKVDSKFARKDITAFRVGDQVRVHVRIKEGEKERIQPYEGMVIKIGNRSTGKSFTVRKISHGVGVERMFLYSSTKVAKVEVVQAGKVRRAKLYYLRGRVGRSAQVAHADRVAAAEPAAN